MEAYIPAPVRAIGPPSQSLLWDIIGTDERISKNPPPKQNFRKGRSTMEGTYDSLLTRFTAQQPCWDRALLERIGEDPQGLADLEVLGLLESRQAIYWLSERGREEFRRAAAECFLEDLPGQPPQDPRRSLMTTRLWLDLEQGHLQRWGLKDYRFDLSIAVRPALAGPLWRLEGQGLRWTYRDDGTFQRACQDFPQVPMAGRSCEGALERRDRWNRCFAPFDRPLKADLLYLCRYDFQHYADFPGYPGDELGLVNADRFFFSFQQGLAEQLDQLGLYHLWLQELRCALVPGYLDVDTQQQDSVNWLLFVSETEEEALQNAKVLEPLGDDLIRPANPMELWTLSLEALEEGPGKQEVIWDLLPQRGHSVCRSLQR